MAELFSHHPASNVRDYGVRRFSPDLSDTSTDSDNCYKRRVWKRREQRRREQTHATNKQRPLLPDIACSGRPTRATPQYRLSIGRLSSHQPTVSSDDDACDSVCHVRSQDEEDEEEEAKLGRGRSANFRPNEAAASGDAMQRRDLRRCQDCNHNNAVQLSSLKYALKVYFQL